MRAPTAKTHTARTPSGEDSCRVEHALCLGNQVADSTRSVHPDNNPAPRRTSIAWSTLKGQRLILQAPPAPLQCLIDEHLVRAGVDAHTAKAQNCLDTIIAMVEAGQGIGIVPASAFPACRYRNVSMTRLMRPAV